MILSSNTCPCCLSEDDFDVINIDVDWPECNREVLVVKFRDVVKEGVLHDGFNIIFPHVDMHDFLADKYKLEFVSSHELLLTMPSMPKW